MRRTRELVLLQVFVLFGMFGICSSCSSMRQPVTVVDLTNLLQQAEPWPIRSTAYSTKSWKQMILVAQRLQKSKPEEALNALRCFQASYANDLNIMIENDGKLFILMRIIFDLPEKAPMGTRTSTWGWVTGGSQYNTNGTVNIEWPLSWNAGVPRLIAGYDGIEGMSERYSASAEYSYFTNKYPFRVLK